MKKILKKGIFTLALSLAIAGISAGTASADCYRWCPYNLNGTYWYWPSCQPNYKGCSNGDQYTLNAYESGGCPSEPDFSSSPYSSESAEWQVCADAWSEDCDYLEKWVMIGWYYPWTGGGQNCSGTCTANCYANRNPTTQAWYVHKLMTLYDGMFCLPGLYYTEGSMDEMNSYNWNQLPPNDADSGYCNSDSCYDNMLMSDYTCETSLTRRIYYDSVLWDWD